MKANGQARKSFFLIEMSVDLVKGFDAEEKALWNAISRGKKWGNAWYQVEQEKRERETSAERRTREAKEKKDRNAFQALIKKSEEEAKKAKELEAKEKELEAKKANVAKKKSRHVNKASGTLKKIAKMCKWQCQGEQCWAHNSKVCPYIHRGESGWNESQAKKPKKGGATCTRKVRKQRKD